MVSADDRILICAAANASILPFPSLEVWEHIFYCATWWFDWRTRLRSRGGQKFKFKFKLCVWKRIVGAAASERTTYGNIDSYYRKI